MDIFAYILHVGRYCLVNVEKIYSKPFKMLDICLSNHTLEVHSNPESNLF